jgi:antitoxin (DNA-binding transcriptional repressor) of toxin-antitoxin stability system
LEGITLAANDPVLERIAAYPWPRGGVQARRVRSGYTLVSTRTGAPVARLKPMPASARYEVLWWRREAWGSAGPFGAVLDLDDALAFIASEPAFWIRT